MKRIWVCVAVLSWLGITHASAAEPGWDNVLDHRLTLYGGAEMYQAHGEFSSTKEGRPKITLDLDDLGLDESAVSPIVGQSLCVP
jgi:hypothetical protein